MPVFADWRDIANLAYPLPGTEGSNPSLSAKPRLWRFSARAAEIARTGGFIHVFSSTGEKRLPVICEQDAADFSVNG